MHITPGRKQASGATLLQLIGFVLFFVLIGGVILIPLLERARQRSYFQQCIVNLRELEDAQAVWRSRHGNFDQIIPEHARDEILRTLKDRHCPAGGVYAIGTNTAQYPSCTIGNHFWKRYTFSYTAPSPSSSPR